MAHRYDASVKYLVSRIEDWLALSGRPSAGPVEVLDTDLSTVSAVADRVVRVPGDPPWIWHLELQASADPTLAGRVQLYNALLVEKYGPPVWTTVVLLRRQADRPEVSGLLERGFPGEEPYRRFRYQVVRVWQLSAEALLSGGLGLVPLAPLSDIAPEGLPDVMQRMEQRIRQEAVAAEANRLWTVAGVLMGLRYPNTLIVELMEGVPGMKESTFYQGILAEGEAVGALREARKLLMRLGCQRFGEPDGTTRSCLEALTDLDRLERMSERLLDVSSWRELLVTP